jgi:hypothetical protein
VFSNGKSGHKQRKILSFCFLNLCELFNISSLNARPLRAKITREGGMLVTGFHPHAAFKSKSLNYLRIHAELILGETGDISRGRRKRCALKIGLKGERGGYR